jgi:tripartite-type tricarboxylate transporter receptor subunit TctC
MRRWSICLLLCGIVITAGTIPRQAAAQPAWPAKPIRLIAPTVPSSFTDLAARVIATELTEQLGQQVIVELRPGAGTTIGAGLVAKSPPDGYTLLITENSFSVTPATYANLPYDPVKDFVHLSLVAVAPTILWARPELPVKSLKELVALSHARPGELTFASGGQGTSSHLAAELFFDKTRMKVIHVPFKGVGASMLEVVAGRVDFGGSSIATPIPHIRSGRLRPLAVTGKARSALLPEVPTFAEAGFPDYDVPIWWGVVLPAGTPQAIVGRLHEELGRALNKPKLKEFFASRGAPVQTSTPAEFTRLVESEIRMWKDLIARTGIKVD